MTNKSQIFVLKTSPKKVIDDYSKLMNLAEYQKRFPKNLKTIIKLNLSWSKFYPACSSPPWQVEGVLKTMIDDGYDSKKIFTAENRTVVTNVAKGIRFNRWENLFYKYGVWFVPLTQIPFIPYDDDLRSKFETLKDKELHVLDSKIFPKGFRIPEFYLGKPIIHLPTMKTHGHTGAVGGSLKQTKDALKNGG
ncbi:MAG: hypothetical protein ACFFAN_11465, partial [Promethearchaeota archaeon]